MWFSWLILIGLILVRNIQCYKIVLVPFPDGFSHVKVLDRIGTELQNRGHEIVFLLSDMESRVDKVQQLKKNIQVYNSTYPKNYLSKLVVPDSVKYGTVSFEKGKELCQVLLKTCDGLLSDNDILNSIQDADLILNDNAFPCGSLLSKKLSTHQVDIGLWGFMDISISSQYHIPLPLSYVPVIPWVTPKMNFFQRTYNYIVSLFFQNLWNHLIMGPIYEAINQKHQIVPDRSFIDFVGDVDMLLMPVDWAVEWPRPILPGVKVVGFIGPKPASSLPPELEEFVQAAADGIVVVSFGSLVSNLDEKYLESMVAALSKLSLRVLWSNIGNYSLPANSNIKSLPWLPQNDLLGHPKTKLFVSHCGLGGTSEAVYHGVPVLAMPLYGDQHLNALKLVTAGFAVPFDMRSDFNNEGMFEDILNDMLANPSYTENARRVSRLVKDRLRSPEEESADWVEYVLRANGTKFLQPEAVNMPAYQHDLIDVKLFLLASISFSLYIVVKLCRCMCTFCCRQKQKEKML